MTRQLDWLALLNFEVLHYGRYQVLPRSKQGEKNAKYSSACFGMFANDRRAQKNHSVDAKSDEVREGEDAAASGRWRHRAVARRGN